MKKNERLACGVFLSEMGKELLPVFYAMMIWGFKHEDDIIT